MALPALRLSGIYMALATAAFAVFLDRWVFNLPDFSVGPDRHQVLRQRLGAGRSRCKLFGVSMGDARSQMVLAVVVFVLVAVLMMAIRTSRFGRRLLAVRDSEAACATFGLDLLGTRLAVFMLSAAIAGLGGAIYATQLSAITPNNFDFFTGLPIFMMVVVGGAGFVGGALFAGIGLYGFLPVLTAIWSGLAKIQTDHARASSASAWASSRAAPPRSSATASPSSATTRRCSAACSSAWPSPGACAWPASTRAGAWWPSCSWSASPPSAWPAPGPTGRWARRSRPATVPVDEVPLEWMGVTVPWTAERLAEIDQRLCLQEFNLGNRAGAGSSVPSRLGRRPVGADARRRWLVPLLEVSRRQRPLRRQPGAQRRVDHRPRPAASPGSSGPTAPARPRCST